MKKKNCASFQLLVVVLATAITLSSQTLPKSELLKQCKVRISEVFGDITGAGNNAFIELQAICEVGSPAEFSLNSYKLVIEQGDEIVGVANFNNQKMNNMGFYTLGGSSVRSKSVGWGTSTSGVVKMKATRGGTSGTTLISSYLGGNSRGSTSSQSVESRLKKPFAVILLQRLKEEYKKASQITKFDFERGVNSLKMTPELEVLIAKYAVDGVVMGNNLVGCSNYERMLPAYEEMTIDYILPQPYKLKFPSSANSPETTRQRRSPVGGAKKLPKTTLRPQPSSGRQQPVSDFFLPKPKPLGTTTRGNVDPLVIQQQTDNQQSTILLASSVSNPGGPLPVQSSTGAASSPGTSTSSAVPSTSSSSTSPGGPPLPPVIPGGSTSTNTGTSTSSAVPSTSSSSTSPGGPPLPPVIPGGSTSTNTGTSTSSAVPSSSGSTPTLLPNSNFASLSRCTPLMLGFIPSAFRITTPTPNIENDCDNGVPVIYVEESLITQEPAPVLDSDDVEMILEVAPTCEIQTVSRGTNTRITYLPTTQNHVIYSELSDDEVKGIASSFVITSRQEDIVRQQIRRSQPGGGPTETPQTTSENKYKEVISHFTKHDSNKIPMKYIKDHKAELSGWLEVTEPHLNENAKLRCSICHSYSKKAHPQLISITKPDLADGWVGTTAAFTRQKLREHTTRGWHAAITSIEESVKAGVFEKARETAIIQSLQNLNTKEKSTSIMALLVYAETRLYVPFHGHKGFVELVEMLGVNLGGPDGYHRNHHSANLFASKISEDLHKMLLQLLYKSKSKFSLLLDTAIDSVGRDYMVLLIQTLLNDVPVVFFYKIVRVGVDSSANGYRKLIEDAFEDDVIVPANPARNIAKYTFLDLAKESLVAVTSDGASVNMGDKGGLIVLLSESLKTYKTGDGSLWKHHCVGHRLNLAIRKVAHHSRAIEKFEEDVKAISKFYCNYNAKKLEHLSNTAIAYQVKPRRVTFAFETRWSNSENLVLDRIRDMLPILAHSTDSITLDQGFGSETQAKAEGIHSIVTSREFVLMVYVLSDIVSVVAAYSLIFQRSGHLTLGLGQQKLDLIQKLNALKDGGGKHVSHLLTHLQCQPDELRTTPWGPCRDFQAILNTQNARFKEQNLGNGKILPLVILKQSKERVDRTRTPFRTTMNQIIDELVAEINSYFPEGEMEALDVLIPSKFDKTKMSTGTYGNYEMGLLSNRFRMDSPRVLTEWTKFCEAIASDTEYEKLTNGKSAEEFWPAVLKKDSYKPHIGLHLRNLLRTILVLPASSADCERAFSAMQMIITSRRTRMTLPALDALLRINLNGPTRYRDFPYFKYGKTWTGRHVIGDPNRKKPGKRPIREDEGEAEASSSKRAFFGVDHDRILSEEQDRAEKEVEALRELEDSDDFVGVGPVDYPFDADSDGAAQRFPDLYLSEQDAVI